MTKEVHLFNAAERAKWHEVARLRRGDSYRIQVAAPGTGFITYRVTRTDDTGVHGVLCNSTIRELSIWDVK